MLRDRLLLELEVSTYKCFKCFGSGERVLENLSKVVERLLLVFEFSTGEEGEEGPFHIQ